MNPTKLKKIATEFRCLDLKTVFDAGAGHIGGEMSVIDILTALYFHVLDIDPNLPMDPQRDRLVLSKGHTSLALYIVLSGRGFFPTEEIRTFLKPLSRLNGHPQRTKVPGVEASTGPLGHGLPIGVGMAKAAKLNKENWHTFVISGDGELQEGSNWEAIMAASQFNLDNLTLIIDHNGLQQGAKLEETLNIAPFGSKFESFGWNVEEINGHDMEAICSTLSKDCNSTGKPRCVIAHTVKGSGISFMENSVSWHHKVPDKTQYELAMAELRGKL